MIDLKALLQDEKSLGKNPYYSYKVSQLEEIDKAINAMKKVETKEELRQNAITMEFDNPDSIVLTFVAGRINLLLNPHEAQVRLNNLMNLFHEKRNFDAAEFVARTILQATETPMPLRVLGEIAETKGMEAEKWSYYERFVRCCSTDTDIIIMVADNYEAHGDKKNARNFYQRTLTRLIAAPDYVKSTETFAKLLKNGASDFSFYSSYISKLGNSSLALDMDKMLLAELLKTKASYTSETTPSEIRKTLENLIYVAKLILTIQKDDVDTRELLGRFLKEKYGASSRYQECARKFDVTKLGTDPVKTLDEFQKNIAYSKNTYVIQNATKKVGLITDVSATNMLTVKFSSRVGDEVKISVQNAMLSLTALSNMDIRAIKKGKKSEVIKAKILGEGGIEWLLKTMLLSSPSKTASIKDMKGEIVPAILNDKEWDNVVKTMKEIALYNSYIDVLNKTTYHLRDYPSTIEERAYETFIGYKDFGKRVDSIMEAAEMENIDFASDSMLEMVSYFTDYLKDDRNSIPTRIESLLVIEYMNEKGVPMAADISFHELYAPLSLSEKKHVYEELSCKQNRKTYIDLVCSTDKKAYDVLEIIFPFNPTKELMKKMTSVNSKKFMEFMTKALLNYKDNLIAFCFFVENGVTNADLKTMKMTRESLVITELNALSFIVRNYADEKQIKAMRSDLIDAKALENFAKTATEEELKRIASHLIWNGGLKDSEKETVKKLISARFPSFDFGEKEPEPEAPREISVVRGFLCTKKSFEAQQAQLKDIKEVQLPHTLKEINDARELGDLRENSEYQYAKDHKRFLDKEYERIATELGTVKVMTMSDVLDGMIGFGTKVTISDNKNGKEIVYTFFGRWESNPDNNVIDINAPIGQALINHKVGDNIQFQIGSNSFDYTIKAIEKVNF